MGDTADNIKGLPKNEDNKAVGAVAAYDYLEHCTSDLQCFRVCTWLWSGSTYQWHDYRDKTPTTWQQHMVADMKLLWMRRTKEEDDVLLWLKNKLM